MRAVVLRCWRASCCSQQAIADMCVVLWRIAQSWRPAQAQRAQGPQAQGPQENVPELPAPPVLQLALPVVAAVPQQRERSRSRSPHFAICVFCEHRHRCDPGEWRIPENDYLQIRPRPNSVIVRSCELCGLIHQCRR